MNYYEPNNNLLRLNWDFGESYRESMSDELMTEFLDPKHFSNPDNISNYWSKPEIILGFNVLLDIAMSGEAVDSNVQNCENLSQEFLKASHLLYQLVATLGQCAFYYDYYRKILERIRSQKKHFINYWERYKAAISKYLEYPPNNTKDQLETSNIMQAFEEFQCLFAHNENTITNPYYAHHLLSMFDDPAHIREFPWLFANRVNDFFEQYLNQPIESTAVAKLDIMNQCIGEVGISINRSICDWWTMDYINSIWNNLQDVATSICRDVNTLCCSCTQPWHPHLLVAKDVSTVRTKINTLIHAVEKMGISTSKYRTYISDIQKGKKCIAYTKVNSKSFVAFSGYVDSTDDQVNEYWKLDFYAFLSAACKSKRVTLAHLSPDVVSRITHYVNGYKVETFRKRIEKEYHNLIYSYPPTPLKDIPQKIASAIGNAYSCCERKILTTLELELGRIGSHKNAIMLVLFSPCQSCFDALRAWEQKYKWQWTIRYCIRYKRK